MIKELTQVFFCLLILGIFDSGQSAAQESGQPLEVDEVLRSTAEHFPTLLEILAAQEEADGKTLSAQGAFDINIDVDGFSRATGFSNGQLVETGASRRLQRYGATVYGGYKISEGRFPIYEDINFTNTAGELKAGVLFPFLRDNNVDAERFGLLDAELNERQVDLKAIETRVDVHRLALVAYWQWINTGRQLEVYESLLRIALERDSALQAQVEKGALAAIALTENQQNITRRKLFVADAERDFELAANTLSLFLRDNDGQPVVPVRPRLPSRETTDRALPAQLKGDAQRLIEDALSKRPEIAQLDVELNRATQQLALAENNLRPRLDLKLEVSHDFGAIAEGGDSRDSTDTVVSLDFSMPVQQRAARGEITQAKARLKALRLQRQRISEQLRVQLENGILEFMVAQNLVDLSGQEVNQAQALTQAEQTRFQNGASDFFLVNLRESNAADARVRLYQAQLRLRVARTTLDAATLDLDSLGISLQQN